MTEKFFQRKKKGFTLLRSASTAIVAMVMGEMEAEKNSKRIKKSSRARKNLKIAIVSHAE